MVMSVAVCTFEQVTRLLMKSLSEGRFSMARGLLLELKLLGEEGGLGYWAAVGEEEVRSMSDWC